MQPILQNQSFVIDPAVEVRDSGWIISGVAALHYPCNAGEIISNVPLGLIKFQSYVVTYEVFNYVNGQVYVLVGENPGTPRTANGVYTETIECLGGEISFFSDGFLSIRQLDFYESVEQSANNVTIAFYDGDGSNKKKWVTNYSYEPEMLIKFINSFFTIKSGALWMHNTNETRNNFYGEQFVSKIQFYDNFNPTNHKLYWTIRVEANTRWFCPNNGDISLLPVVGRSLGMSSRIKRNNFKNYQGSFFADFMRNYLDTRFNDPELALFKGEPLRGRIMDITVTNDDVTEAILFEIDVKTTPSAITY